MPAENEKPPSPDAAYDLGLQSFSQPPDEEGLSLEQLSQAFAQMLGCGADPYSMPTEESTGATTGPTSVYEPETTPADDGCEISPRSILEAMLFVGNPENQPLTSSHVASLMRGVRPAEIDQCVRDLNAAYQASGCPFYINGEAAGYRLCLREEYTGLRDKLLGRARQVRLSPAALEVLALVAYGQAETAEQISSMRGTPSGHILAQLVRRQLLRLEREQSPPRRARYHVTGRLLELFGLETLEDLPRSQELERR